MPVPLRACGGLLLLLALASSLSCCTPVWAQASAAANCPSLPISLSAPNNASFYWQPGTVVRAGYALSNGGASANQALDVQSAVIRVQAHCTEQEFADDEGNTLQIVWTLPAVSYTTLKPNQWYPSGDATTAASFQASLTVPNLCNGGPVYAAVTGNLEMNVRSVGGNNAKLVLLVKFHYESLGGLSTATFHNLSSRVWSSDFTLGVVCPLTTSSTGTTLTAAEVCEAGKSAWPVVDYNFTCCDPTTVPKQVSVTVGEGPRNVRMFKWPQSMWLNCYQPTFTQCIYQCGRTISYCMDVADRACWRGPWPGCADQSAGPGVWGAKACAKNRWRAFIHITRDSKQLAEYQAAQNAACMCVTCDAACKNATANPVTTSPSPLESWPLAAIDPATGTQDLFGHVSLDDFVPAALSFRTWSGLTSSPPAEVNGVPQGVVLHAAQSQRPDIVALSSASEVLGVDYRRTDATGVEAEWLHGGLILAKGSKVIEHSVPTCARFAGGRVLAVVRSEFAGSDGVKRGMLVGVVEQADGAGAIQTATLVLEVFADRMRATAAWSASQLELEPGSMGVLTLQMWAPIHSPQTDPQVFPRLVAAMLDRLAASVVPVTFAEMQAPSITRNSLSLPVEPLSPAEDALAANVSAIVPAVVDPPSLFWFESVSFEFPHTVLLTLKANAPVVPDLQLRLLCWTDANQHVNRSVQLTLSPTSFDPAASELLLLRPVYTSSVRLELEHIQDVVVVAAYADTHKEAQMQAVPDQTARSSAGSFYVDQVFTNLGYMYFVGTNGGALIPGYSAAPSSADPLPVFGATYLRGSTSLAGSARVVVPSRSASPPPAADAFGGARALTPTDAPVDVSAYWGVGLLVRLNVRPSSASTADPTLFLQLRVESADISDFNYPISTPLALRWGSLVDELAAAASGASSTRSATGCWAHVQLSWKDFASDAHPQADVRRVQRLSWLVSGAASHIDVSVASMSLLRAPLPLSVRQAVAPCSELVSLHENLLGDQRDDARFAISHAHAQHAHGAVATLLVAVMIACLTSTAAVNW